MIKSVIINVSTGTQIFNFFFSNNLQFESSENTALRKEYFAKHLSHRRKRAMTPLPNSPTSPSMCISPLLLVRNIWIT